MYFKNKHSGSIPKHSYKCMRDYQSVTTGQTDRQTDGQTDGRTDAGQSDPYVPLCLAGDTKITTRYHNVFKSHVYRLISRSMSKYK